MELTTIPLPFEPVKSKPEIISLNSATQKKNFRSLNYLGSKLRMLDFIEETINEISPNGGAVCDLFTGSGSVAKRLSETRTIIAVDIQEYSKVICSALLKPCTDIDSKLFVDSCKNSSFYNELREACASIINYEANCISQALAGEPSLLCEFLEEGSLIKSEIEEYKNCSTLLESALRVSNKNLKNLCQAQNYDITATRYFGGVYFSFEQAIALDALNHGILKEPIEYRDTLTAALLGTASNIVNTVGKQFAQPIQPRAANGLPKKGIGAKANKDRSIATFSSFREMLEKYCDAPRNDLPHSAIRMDYSVALDQLPQDVEVVYADPPYTRDHYSRFYHVLETLCLRDNPEISKVKIKGEIKLSRALYREDRHQSPFCIRSTAPIAFENLFEKVSDLGASLVLSYSPFASNVDEHPRVMTIEKLVSLAKKYFSSVEKRCPGVFKHNKLNSRANSFDEKPNGELLIVCRN